MPRWFVEHRRSPRVEINASGRLIVVSQRLRLKENIACTVVNVSPGGALIEASSGVGEDEFYLEIDSHSRANCSRVELSGGKAAIASA